MLRALHAGWNILQNGGSALDAVEKACNILEDDPLFDAGTGSHLNADGIVEMDAILIDASTHNFGAVAGVQRVRYPISLARKVLEETEQNFFVGAGADALAARLGVPLVPNITLVSPGELHAYLNQDTSGASDTVGAVAIDQAGKLAVATSTGGTPAKPAGRVGDCPIFGAGGYADPELGGASATGKGEHCMRVLLTKWAVDAIRSGSVKAAADAAMNHIDHFFNPSMVGIIMLDKDGRPAAAHTTPKMSCAWIDQDGNPRVTMKGGVW
jgi:beta-aspartyl-peptidase (threonine type)